MNNEPAFPTQHANYSTGEHAGMTLRDYFAAKVLIALAKEALDLDHQSWDATAQHAYWIADAMLEARQKGK